MLLLLKGMLSFVGWTDVQEVRRDTVCNGG